MAAVDPKTTVEEELKLVPEISTTVPPPVAPLLGLIEVTWVADVYVNVESEFSALVPPGVITFT